MDNAIRHKRSIYWVSAVIIILGIIIYYPADLYFLNDDLLHIPLSSKLVLLQHNSWRPVCDLVIAFNWYLWQQNAFGYHLTELLVHCINTLLTGVFVHTLFKQYMPSAKSRFVISWLSAVLFFVYAFHSEAVFWIIGQAASLVMLFALPAFIFYLKRHNASRNIWLSFLYFHIALLTYESVWIFPVLAILFSAVTLYQGKSLFKKELLYLMMIWVSFIIHLFIRYNYIGEVAGKYEAGNFKALNVSVLAANFGKLLIRTFLPPVQQSSYLLVSAGILLIIFITLFYYIKKKKVTPVIPLLAGLCLLFSYLPYLSLGIDTHGVESERYLYMPSVFAVILLAFLIVTVLPHRFTLPAFLLVGIYQLFFLYISRSYFLQASHLSQATFRQINVLSNKKRLFIDSLPDEVRGALVFRLGFLEGINWLKNSNTVDSIIVLSRKVNDTGDEVLTGKKVEVLIFDADKIPVQMQSLRFDAATGTYKKDNVFITNPASDVYLRYDKNQILIWK